MAQTLSKNATYADLAAVPGHLVAEIRHGELLTHPRPAAPHVTSGNALQIELGGPFQKGKGGPGGWIFAAEPEFHLRDDILVPDLAGWRLKHMPHLPATAYYETPPDFICEILPKSAQAMDRGSKRRIYAQFGVKHLWHLDPVARLLEVFNLNNKQWVLFDSLQEGDDVKAPPFAAAPFCNQHAMATATSAAEPITCQ